MTRAAKKTVLTWLLKLGWRVERRYPPDIAAHVIETIERVAAFSSSDPLSQPPPARYSVLCDAVDYIVEHDVPGSIVECGVFRGASMMAAALELSRLGVSDRELVLFDTFSGMPAPSDKDVSVGGQVAYGTWKRLQLGNETSTWAAASLDEVRQNMLSTGYDPDRIHLVKGKVEDTLPGAAPEEIALLRLDTDWYESTRHELIHLFPRISPGGVLILDDYGHWAGARCAADEYFRDEGVRIFLNRVDYSARVAVKQELLR
jgi:O-methyltransferase